MFHKILITVAFLGIYQFSASAQIVESQLEVNFDKASGIYIVGGFDESVSLIYPNGSVDAYDREYTPFTYRSQDSVTAAGLGPFLLASKFGGRTGIESDGQAVYRLSADGSHDLVNVFAGGLLPCEMTDPRDFCFLAQSYNAGIGELVTYSHRTLADQVVMWNGSSYEPPSEILTRMSMEDLVVATFLQSHIVPFGTSGDIVEVPLVPERSLQSFATIYSNEGAFTLSVEHPPYPGDPVVQQVLPFVDAIYASVETYPNSPKKEVGYSIYKIALSSGQPELSDITPRGEDFARADWLGIDAQGIAYAFRPIDHSLVAFNLAAESVQELKTCGSVRRPSKGTSDYGMLSFANVKKLVASKQQRIPAPLRRTMVASGDSGNGLWVLCDSELIGLRSGEVRKTISVPSNLLRLSVASDVDEPLEALAFYPYGRQEIWHENSRIPVQRLSQIGSYDYNDTAAVGATYWDDGQKFCRTKRRQASFYRQASSECFDAGKWSESNDTFNVRDMFEANDFSYALTEELEGPTLYRKPRSRTGDWERLASVMEARPGAEARFIPASSSSGMIGFYVSGLGIYTYSDYPGLRKVPVETSQLVLDLRPALSDNGWLYAFCKSGDGSGGARPMVQICAFDWAGNRSDLGRVSEQSIRGSGTGGFVPLARGAMSDVMISTGEDPSGFVGRAPILVYRNTSIRLSRLFGEFAYSPRSPWAFDVTMGTNGQAYILRADEIKDLEDDESGSPPYYHLFEFDGRRLLKLASAPRTIRDRVRKPLDYSDGDPRESSWDQLNQVWKRSDSLWISTSPDVFIPMVLSKSLPSLIMGIDSEYNPAPAGTKHFGQVVLANGAGLWFCSEVDAPVLTALSPRVLRHPNCRHHGYVGFPTQLESIGAEKILALSGEEIQLIDTSFNRKTVIARGVKGKFVSVESDNVWFVGRDGVFSTSLINGATSKAADLPAGVKAEDVYLTKRNLICTKSGVFANLGGLRNAWTQILARCDAAMVIDTGLSVFADKKLYQCTTQNCHPIAELPSSAREDVVMATHQSPSRPMLIASGNEVYKLNGNRFERCLMSTALGDHPRSGIKFVSDDLLVTSAGSAYITSCGDGFQSFRIH